MRTAADLDCLTCGACCAPPEDWPAYVEVTDTDARRLPEIFRAFIVDGELATRARPGGIRCIALTGVLGRCVACAIHRTRPDACRKFEKGSGPCHEARRDVLGVDRPQGPTLELDADADPPSGAR